MDIEATLQQALQLIDTDLQTIRVKALSEPLDRTEATKLNDYIRTLIMVSKNNREVSKLEGLQNISDDELEQLTKDALKSLGATK